MKLVFIVVVTSLLAVPAVADTNPIQKVIQLISGLQTKIIREGGAAQKVYAEFTEWCEDRSQEMRFEIKTAKAEKEQLEATIEKAGAKADALSARIEALTARISTDEADLKAAAAIRARANLDFSEREKELSDTVGTLQRAIGILEKEVASGSMSLVQTKSAGDLAQVLSVMVEASALSADDVSKLTSMLQSSSDDEDSDIDAPAPASYENHSGGIIGTLQDIMAKAQSSLEEARARETSEKNNYMLFKQALDDKVKFATNDVDQAKKERAAAEETKATAQGDLVVTSKDLDADRKSLESLHHECLSRANDFEGETMSRGQELKALAAAKKVISDSTNGSGGAEDQTYSGAAAASLVQVRMRKTTAHAELSDFKLVRFVRQLAQKTKSRMLVQLAKRLSTAIRNSDASGEDPFVKVKGLITEMVDRLIKEADAEASKKEHCDKELAETEANKEDKEDNTVKLTARIDKMKAGASKLKEESAMLQRELADLAKSQAEADKLRFEEHAAYVNNKAELEEGLEGMQVALKVLRDYYAAGEKAHDSAEGAASGIIGLLEVAEADFSGGLSEMTQEEGDAAQEHEKNSKENDITQAAKEQDLKYKTKDAKALDQSVAEAGSDRDGVQTELDAINEYYAKVKEECIAKAEPYAERKARRESEIAGLKEAMSILEGEAVFLQTSTSTHRLRGMGQVN